MLIGGYLGVMGDFAWLDVNPVCCLLVVIGDFLSFDDFAILQKLHEDAEMAFFAHQCLL